jgi:hypothetical protein
MVLAFQEEFTLEGCHMHWFHAFVPLEASMRAVNDMPLACRFLAV